MTNNFFSFCDQYVISSPQAFFFSPLYVLSKLMHDFYHFWIQASMLRFWPRFEYIQRKPSFYLTHEIIRLTLRILYESSYKENHREFPGGTGVETYDAGSAGLIPGLGAKIPLASWLKNKTIKQRQCCNKLNRLKVVHIKKNKIK